MMALDMRSQSGRPYDSLKGCVVAKKGQASICTSRNTPPSTSLKRLYRACNEPCWFCKAEDWDGDVAILG